MKIRSGFVCNSSSSSFIIASDKPTLISTQKNTNSILTGWTTAVTAGDIIAFNLDSASTLTNINVILKITKS
jgi:hypothetical protein